mgnify:CR=1 FL=1
MNISNTYSSVLPSGVNNKPTTPIKNSQRLAEPVVEIEQKQSSNKQAKTNIVIDEQAIALFEKNQAEKNQAEQNQVAVSTQAQQDNGNSFDKGSSASQDQPSAKNETAVASYQAVGNLAQRESVQQLFGVDIYA